MGAMAKDLSTVTTETQVVSRAQRRRFTVEYKSAVVQEAEGCRSVGEVGALLRREGLYSSHLTAWRKLYRAGARRALSTRRGPKAAPRATPALAALQRENARLQDELAQCALVIEIQKKVSSLLAASPLAPRGGT